MPRTVVIGKRRLSIPSDWSEFSPIQLELIARIANTELPLETSKLFVVLNILDMRITGKAAEDVFRFVWRGRHGVITLDKLESLTAAFDFLYASLDDHRMVMAPAFTFDPYPHLTDGLRPFHSPGDFFEYVTYDQFVYANTYTSQLSSDPSAHARLLACLWHRRRCFDPERIDDDARLLARMPLSRRTVMFWYWAGCNAAVRQRFPRVFSGSGNGSDNVFEDQQRVINALADNDVTKVTAVRHGFLLDALISMDEAIRQAEETKKSLQR